MATKKKATKAAGSESPAVVPSEPEAPKEKAPKALSAADELAEIEKHLAVLEERERQLLNPVREFPKMLPNGVVVENAEQEAAALGRVK